MSEFRGDVVVQASPATCYALWNDLDALEFFLPGFRGERMADGVSANCSIEVTYGDSPERTPMDTHRFMAHVTECEQDVVVHWQSTDGFPCGVVAGFWPNEDGDVSGTRVRVEPYCHLPFGCEVAEDESGFMRAIEFVQKSVSEGTLVDAGAAASKGSTPCRSSR